jgi:6-phosphogluconolactonase (cycloisomerase 2 family)
MRFAYAITLVLGALGLAAIAGCTANAADVSPPDDQIFFPTALAVAPDDSVLWVASSNSNLQYNSGTISVIDLAVVDQVVDGWLGSQTIPANCSQDPNLLTSIICDETHFVTSIGVQDRGSGALRLIVPTRGDPSITWIDIAPGSQKLDCTSSQGFAICDDNHRLTDVRNDPNVAELEPEPFDVYVDSLNQFAMVTHLSTGAISLIDSPADGSAVISDVAYNLFMADPETGIVGSTAIAGRNPTSADDIVYVGALSEDRIQMMTVGHPVNDDYPFLIPGNYFFLQSVGSNAGASEDTRAMLFSPDGNTMYLANRLPPSLQVYDTSAGANGFPANNLLAAMDICEEVSQATLLDAGDGPRIFLSCFQDGEVYVVDPTGAENLVANITEEGQGPYSIVSAPTRKKVYVTNFLEDTIGVIDDTPGSPTRNRVVLRIGIPIPPTSTTEQTGL